MANYYTKSRKGLNKGLDRFAEGMSEQSTTPYQVTVIVPVRGLIPPKEYNVVAVFSTSPTPATLEAYGIKNALNGLLYIRDAHLPDGLEFVSQDNGHPKMGYSFIVRGRKYHPTRFIADDGVTLVTLQDKLE